MRKVILITMAVFISTAMIFAKSTLKNGPDHPNYLHALSDLRAARWMLEHRPGNWQQTNDEVNAVKQIDAAINEIKKAAIDDGKNINDHPPVDERPDHGGRLQAANDFLIKAREDVNKEEDNNFAKGLRNRAIQYINEALRLTNNAIHASATPAPAKAPAPAPTHPNYLTALSDLRAARWMLEHRPGNWQQTNDEVNAVNQIDAAINEIKKAAIDDGKDINDHPPVDERPDHGGRLHAANDFLLRARGDVNKEEDNAFAQGLRNRALQYISEALRLTNYAIAATPPPAAAPAPTAAPAPAYSPAHPSYLHALSDLRAARWMLEHRPGNWIQSRLEQDAVNQIDAAIDEIKRASIDDGKDINDHPAVDENPDHGGRLHAANDFLLKARDDVNQEEDNAFAQGLRNRAIQHINEALKKTNAAIAETPPPPQQQAPPPPPAPAYTPPPPAPAPDPAYAPAHPSYLHALSDLRAARWMLEHRPGNWIQSRLEQDAVNQIDAAIDEIKRASIDDGKDINDHPQVDENPDHGGRLHAANDFLLKARDDVNQEEDNAFAQGLRNRAIQHINEALKKTNAAIAATTRQAEHPNYLQALSDLRAARWMLEHRPGKWVQTSLETDACNQIDAAISEIRQASVDDGKDINDHPPVDERPDHVGRLHAALDYLAKAREDVNKEEDNGFAQGLRNRALQHINEAVKKTDAAIKQK